MDDTDLLDELRTRIETLANNRTETTAVLHFNKDGLKSYEQVVFTNALDAVLDFITNTGQAKQMIACLEEHLEQREAA